MQTYLPYKVYKKSIEVLSTEMLLTQRNNAYDLLSYILHELKEYKLKKKKYLQLKNELNKHPIFYMWWNHGKPFAKALFHYLDACNFELFNRNEKIMKIKFLENYVIRSNNISRGKPPTPKRITSGYRLILLCRDEKYYKKVFYKTYKENRKMIKKLSKSKEKWKFAKLLKIFIPS